MVAACVILPTGEEVYGVNHMDSEGLRIHAERAALNACETADRRCMIVTTLSPCNRPMDGRHGESCTDLIAYYDIGLENIYCGYKDPTQDEDGVEETNNPKLRKLCKQFADTFLKENFADGKSMSTKDMIAYLKQHHDTNLHQDYLDHLNTFGKFVLKNIPVNTLKTELSGLDRAKVERYKQMDFSKAPPIVMGDGYILDGYHRAVAAKELGIPTIKGYVGIKGQQDMAENFADGKVKGKSRPGRVKRAGASCKGSVTDLRAKAKNASGERAKMYHWCANMKSGRKK